MSAKNHRVGALSARFKIAATVAPYLRLKLMKTIILLNRWQQWERRCK